MLLRLIGALCAAAAIAYPAAAQAVRSQASASNGIAVTVYSDEFAGRYEYSGPTISFGNGGNAIVAKIIRGDAPSGISVQGFIHYRGEWRRYSSAVYRGGDEANFTSTGRDVVSCSGSRYGGCSLSESFIINLTPQDIEKRAIDGKIEIQLRGEAGAENPIISVPVAHIVAVQEVGTR